MRSAAFLASLMVVVSTVAARADQPFPEQMPSRLIECENNKKCDAVWIFGDNGGKAQWANGTRADLSVERFDRERIIIRRDDTTNPGFTALYIGTLSGSKMSGTVTWSWPGHWSDNVEGVWSATVDATNRATVPTPEPTSAAQIAAPKRVTKPPVAAKPPHQSVAANATRATVVTPARTNVAPTAVPKPVAKPKPKPVAKSNTVAKSKPVAKPVSRTVAVNTTPAPSGAALEAHFRRVWSSDQCVQQRQSWEDYAGWVYRFYSDPQGWNANASAITARITDRAVREKEVAELNALGVRVAGEWAKDNSCRKIRTSAGFFNAGEAGKPALTDFSDVLQSAAAADTGSGARIEAAIQQIARVVDQLLGQ